MFLCDTEWIHNGTCPEMTHPVFDDVIGAVPCPLSCNSIFVDNDCDVTEKCCRTPCNPNSWKCITPLQPQHDRIENHNYRTHKFNNLNEQIYSHLVSQMNKISGQHCLKIALHGVDKCPRFGLHYFVHLIFINYFINLSLTGFDLNTCTEIVFYSHLFNYIEKHVD